MTTPSRTHENDSQPPRSNADDPRTPSRPRGHRRSPPNAPSAVRLAHAEFSACISEPKSSRASGSRTLRLRSQHKVSFASNSRPGTTRFTFRRPRSRSSTGGWLRLAALLNRHSREVGQHRLHHPAHRGVVRDHQHQRAIGAAKDNLPVLTCRLAKPSPLTQERDGLGAMPVR
jgi:hypothetical protein